MPAPLFDQPEFLEYPPNHAGPQLGNALPDIFHSQAGIFDLDPVIEKGNPDRCAFPNNILFQPGSSVPWFIISTYRT
jgi:hypothetical protein